MRQVGSVIFWAFVVVSSLLLFPIAVLIWLVTAPFGPRRVWLHRFTCFWGSLYTWVNPLWRVKVTGRQNIEAGRTYMLVANHLSLLDILVVFRLFKDFVWVSKAEVFRVPVIGWNMRLNRYIPLRRGDRDSVIEMMAAARTRLRQGSSIMMFPEGTRSKEQGRLRPFKLGAFELAQEADCPIVPMVIKGTGRALPKRGFVLQGRHDISLEVLPAIPVEQVRAASPEQMAAHVEGVIGDRLRQAD